MAAPATNGSPSQYRLFVGIVAGAAVVILLLTQLVGGNGEQIASSDTSDEVRLEPLSYTPSDAFTSSIAADEPDAPDPAAARLPVEPASEGTIRSAPADTVGLYGGSLNNASCDREQLVAFLESDPVKAQAWVDALNSDPTLQWSGGTSIDVTQIRDYVFELTPVILRTDTWVTNHGFTDGRAVPLQSLLQAGTAVLVDSYGVPRVRCFCGNPLLPPRTVRPVFTGPRWDGFDPDRVLIVNNSVTVIQTFVLTDVETGVAISRDAGTEGEADVEGEPLEPEPLPTESIAPTPPEEETTDVGILAGRYSVGQYRKDPSCAAVENNVTALEISNPSIGSDSVVFRPTFRDGTSHNFKGHITPELVGIVDLQKNGSSFQLNLQFTVSGSSVEAEGTIHLQVEDLFSCTDQATFVK